MKATHYRKRTAVTLAANRDRLDRYRDNYNPLRGLSIERCHLLVESFANGQFTDLMWAFGRPGTGIESSDPDLLALIDKRASRMRDMEWSIQIIKGHDQEQKALDQQAALQSAYDRFDNLYTAIGDLAMSKFRSLAVVEVDWEASMLRTIEPWNLVRDGYSGNLAYNPAANSVAYTSIPEENRYNPEKHWWITRTSARPIGAWALYKAFYCGLGARDWGSYCGIYGIPGGIVIGPPTMSDSEKVQFESAAALIATGGSGALPYGSSYSANSDARGQLPFEPWMDWLSKKLILAGTGGALTMLSDSTGLGSGNADNHADTFSELAKSDSREIAECFNNGFDRRVLLDYGLLAPGEKPLAYFSISANEDTNVSTIIDHASKLATAGLEIDIDELSDRTGYTILRKPMQSADQTALQTPGNALQVAPNKESESPTTPKSPKPLDSPKIAELLAMIDKPDATDADIQKALDYLDTLTPSDIGADEKAKALEAKLMAAMIAGAAFNKSSPVATNTEYVRDSIGRFAETGSGMKKGGKGLTEDIPDMDGKRKAIVDHIQQLRAEGFDDIGLRTTDDPEDVDNLDRESRVWVDGKRTRKRIGGLSATNVTERLVFARHGFDDKDKTLGHGGSYFGDNHYLVAGYRDEGTDGQDNGERVIKAHKIIKL